MGDRRVTNRLRDTLATRIGPRCRPVVLAVGAVLAAAAVSGCGEARQAFGLDRATPDEFAVVPRAPLTLPPDYALRPPAPGAPRPQEDSMRVVARRTIIGGPEPEADAQVAGSGEQVLLQQAGADAVIPDIRQVVERESADLLLAEESFVNQLLNWQEDRVLGRIVDAPAEAERLAASTAVGDPLNQGEVPTIERQGRTPLAVLLEEIF